MKVVYRIREVAAVRGVTFRELSRRAGMANPGISQIVSGRHGTSVDALLRIAEALDVPWSVLLDVTDDEGNVIERKLDGVPTLPTYREWAASPDGSRPDAQAVLVDGMARSEHRGRPRNATETEEQCDYKRGRTRKPRIRLAEPTHETPGPGRNRVFANDEEVEALGEAAKSLLSQQPQ